MLDIQMTWERETKREEKRILELSQEQKEIWRCTAFSLAHTGDIHNSGYIKFSTLSVLSVFDAPVFPCVNSCLFLFCCLNDCRSVFHVEKKNMVKTLSAGYPSLIQSQLHSGGWFKLPSTLSQELSTAGEALLNGWGQQLLSSKANKLTVVFS